MNIYRRIFRPATAWLTFAVIMSSIIYGGYLIWDAIARLISQDHSPWYKHAMFLNFEALGEMAVLALVFAAILIIVAGLPYSYFEYRKFARYCHLKGLNLSDLSRYSHDEIDEILPTLEQLDDNAKVYFDEYVQEHYFECPELKEFQWRDRIKISEYQHYRAMIGKLSKEKLLAKARKKSQHRWHQRSDS